MSKRNDFTKFAIGHLGINSNTLNSYSKSIKQPTAIMTPHIVEEREMNMVTMSVFDRLMKDRIIFLGDAIDSTLANIINAQMLYLNSLGDTDIQMYINSPGGEVYAGLGMYDVMQYIKPDVITINTGVAASMAAVLLCAGTNGKRKSLKHARTMIHQPSGGAGGQASDIEISYKQIIELKSELYDIIAKHSKQKKSKVIADGDRDYWMMAKEAKAYGMIDTIL